MKDLILYIDNLNLSDKTKEELKLKIEKIIYKDYELKLKELMGQDYLFMRNLVAQIYITYASFFDNLKIRLDCDEQYFYINFRFTGAEYNFQLDRKNCRRFFYKIYERIEKGLY